MEGWSPEEQGARINGWHFYWYHLFQNYYLELLEEGFNLLKKDPENFHHHSLYKLLDCITKSIQDRIATNPQHKDFILGNTLGRHNRHWKRVKQGLPNR